MNFRKKSPNHDKNNHAVNPYEIITSLICPFAATLSPEKISVIGFLDPCLYSLPRTLQTRLRQALLRSHLFILGI